LKSPSELRIPLEAGATTALAYTADSSAFGALVLGHGAGAGQRSTFMVQFARAISALGVDVITFNFLYTEHNRRIPDRAPVLEACYRAVIASVHAQLPAAKRALFIGGKSMGGRIASMVADEVGARGLVCLGYPFHPPGRPEKLGTKHLETLATPALVVQGTRYPFGTAEDVAGYRLSPAIRVVWLQDGDHSWKPRAASGRSEAQNMADAIAAIREFLASL